MFAALPQVNAALPPTARTEDHDRALASALRDDALCAQLLPSVTALPAGARNALRAAAAAGFNLPQAAQGEAPLAQLTALSAAVAAEPALREGTALEAFLQHCVFDIAGASCSDRFALPLAIEPVFVGFCRAKDRLLKARRPPRRWRRAWPRHWALTHPSPAAGCFQRHGGSIWRC